MAREDLKDALSPAAIEVDHELARMDGEIDWLTRLTPVNLDEVFAGFRDSGFKAMPALRYDEGLPDLHGMRERLFALPVRDIVNTLIESLLIEKQRELDRQLELVRLRGKPGFVMASVDLFGEVGDRLVDQAEAIIDKVPAQPPDRREANADAFIKVAEDEIAWYRERAPELSAKIVKEPHPGTHIFVCKGNLHVACDYDVPISQIVPLLNHEVGTHIVTRHNGRQQPLKTLEVGLADYDALQEGLGVLAEYLCGYLPANRLRTLAARVIAARMAIDEEDPADIFSAMYERCHLGEELSFSTTVRALRGGGMTKDALYLGGLVRLLAYLAHDEDFETLFIGKFALKHMPTLEKLLEHGVLAPPALLPRYLENPRARQRLARARTIDVTQLWQEAPDL
jgi:uncharacterized protein (TIGR02421 family)